MGDAGFPGKLQGFLVVVFAFQVFGLFGIAVPAEGGGEEFVTKLVREWQSVRRWHMMGGWRIG